MCIRLDAIGQLRFGLSHSLLLEHEYEFVKNKSTDMDIGYNSEGSSARAFDMDSHGPASFWREHGEKMVAEIDAILTSHSLLPAAADMLKIKLSFIAGHFH